MPRPAARPPDPATDRAWWLTGTAAALLALLMACRGAVFGEPVGDDYHYLYDLTFRRPLDFFDSMGFGFYWRPLSRQTYYLIAQAWLLSAPWVTVLAHAVLLAGLAAVLYRVARRGFPPPVAAAAATFPLLAESARPLLVWPVGGEYLLPMLGTALAVHETLAGRLWTAALAALAGLLSHEAAALALPALPLLAWARRRSRREALVWGAAALGVALVWLAGRAVAETHGALWFAGGTGEAGGRRSPAVDAAVTLWRALASQLNLEDLRAPWTAVIGGAYAALGLLAAGLAWRDRQAHSRLTTHAPGLAAAATWFVAGVAPLALLPDWNSWRASLAGLWLGVALCGALGLVRTWLVYALIAVRLTALLLAPAAPAVVTERVPQTTSVVSYARLTRLQRIAASTRRALREARPTLPRGATVAYWSRLPIMEVGLAPPKSVRVWYADSTLAWRWYWDPADPPAPDNVLAFDAEVASPAVMLEKRALLLVKAAEERVAAGNLPGADSLFADAYRTQQARPSREFTGYVSNRRACIAYNLGALSVARRFNGMVLRATGATADYLAMVALLAIEERQWPLAAEAARRSLTLEPENASARLAVRLLRERAGGTP